MPSLHWERVLLGIACCAVTVILCSLCIWQLVVRFHKGKKYSSAPFELYPSSPCSSAFSEVLKLD